MLKSAFEPSLRLRRVVGRGRRAGDVEFEVPGALGREERRAVVGRGSGEKGIDWNEEENSEVGVESSIAVLLLAAPPVVADVG